jgi:hypothetical protein
MNNTEYLQPRGESDNGQTPLITVEEYEPFEVLVIPFTDGDIRH